MKEAFTNALEELKRVDHLLYVSLKYTRSVDVIRNVIGRIINALDFLMETLLIDFEERDIIDGIPTLPVQRANILLEKAEDPRVKPMVEFYLLMRKVMRAEYTASKEFRRHVTMSFQINDVPMQIDIDKVHEYYIFLKEQFDFVMETVKKDEKKEDE